MYQKQKQVQFSVQQQSLAYSYNILGNLLSSAENFAGMPNNQYAYYNISKAKNEEDLRQEFVWELYCFQLSLEKLLEKFDYDKYPYPEKAPKKKILDDINMWKSKKKNSEDKKLFDAMKDIINGRDPKINYDDLFDSLDSNKKFNPKRLNQIILPLNYTLDQIVTKANEREKIGRSPSFHIKETMPYNSGMDKLRNLNIDNCDNIEKKKNLTQNDFMKDNEKLYEISLGDGKKLCTKLTQENIYNKYIVLNGTYIHFENWKEIK